MTGVVDQIQLKAPLRTVQGDATHILEVDPTSTEVAALLVAMAPGRDVRYTLSGGSPLSLARLRRQMPSTVDVVVRAGDQGEAINPQEEDAARYDIIVAADRATLERFQPLLAEDGRLFRVIPAPDAGQPTLTPEVIDAPFPLTDIQHAYWLGRSQDSHLGGVACHVYVEWELDALDLDRLERCWNRLIQRHGMLRAIIEDTGSQRMLRTVPWYRIARDDQSSVCADIAKAAQLKTRTEMCTQVMDAAAWPLFDLRMTLLPGGRKVLHLDVDLLIVDVQSYDILLGELETLYRDEDAALEPVNYTFRDYQLQRGADRETATYQADRTWWLEELETLPAAPDLPVNPAAGGVSHTRLNRTIPPQRWRALEDRARQASVTPTAMLLSAFSAVLAHWSQRRDFTINLTQFDRRPMHPDVGKLVGDFTSVLLVGLNGCGSRGFADDCREVYRTLWRALSHRSFSGVEVMRELGQKHCSAFGATQMPVVFTSLLGLNLDDLESGHGGAPVFGAPQHLYTCTPQLWLDHQAMVRNGALEYNWIVTDQVFPDGLADEMFAAYGRVLDHLAKPDVDWSAPLPADLFCPGAVKVRRAINAVAAPLSEETLDCGFWRHVADTPEATALVTPGGRLSYKALASIVSAKAHALRAAGAHPNETVAVMLPKGVQQIAGVLAVLRIGCAYAPLAPDTPPARLEAIARQLKLRHAFASPDASLPATVDIIADDAIAHDGSRPNAIGDLRHSRTPSDLAYVIFTSGSTGQPKGVSVSHRAALNTIDAVNEKIALGPDDRIFGLSALTFDLSVYDIFGAFRAGAALVLPGADQGKDPGAWARLMAQAEVTVWNSVPQLMQMMIAEPVHDDWGAALRWALLSGDWVPTGLPRQINKACPHATVAALGGATEAGIWSNWFAPAHAPDGMASIPYGYPLANQGYAVLDDQLNDRPDWVEGDLYITGAGLADGYFADPQRTDASFFNHPHSGERLYRTGDRGRYWPGGLLEFRGRTDSQIKLNGFRIEIGEIESALNALPGVSNTVVGLTEQGPRQLVAWVQRDVTVVTATTTKTHHGDPERSSERWRRLVQHGRANAENALPEDVRRSLLTFHEIGRDLACLAMQRSLHSLGLWRRGQRLNACNAPTVAERYRPLIGHWSASLRAANLLDSEHRVVEAAPSDLDGRIDAKLAEMRAANAWLKDGAGLVDWIETSVKNLVEILQSPRETALSVLFPDGDLSRGEALYRDNALSEWLGELAAQTAAAVADEPINVLEVGAGVGGLTSYAYPVLDSSLSRYLYTDLSRQFLNAGESRFGADERFETGVFDITAPPMAQMSALSLQPCGQDLILAGNVLHSAVDVVQSLGWLRSLLRPGGVLVMIEATRNEPLQLVTGGLLEGFGDHFQDSRAQTGLPMLSAQGWLDALSAAGFARAAAFPAGDAMMAAHGQAVIAAQAPDAVAVFDQDAVKTALAQRLPDYMIPKEVIEITALPLTANGKLDRSLLPLPVVGGTANGARRPPVGAMECGLAKIWSPLFGGAEISADDDFFALGGDSLLATRMVAEIRNTLGCDAPLRQVFETPVLADLARSLTPGERSSRKCGVVLSAGDAPVFCLPATDGFVAAYTGLARALEGTAALWGRDAPGLHPGTAPMAGFEQQLAHFSAALPEGDATPLLLGWSMGAHTAWGLARLLQQQGRAVSDVILVDPTPMRPFQNAASAIGQADSEGALLMAAAPPGWEAIAAHDARSINRLTDGERLELWRALLRTLRLPESFLSSNEALVEFRAVLSANIQAALDGAPAPLPDPAATRVHVFYASHRDPYWGDDPLEDWAEVLPTETASIRIEGDHRSILRQQDLVDQLRELIVAATSR